MKIKRLLFLGLLWACALPGWAQSSGTPQNELDAVIREMETNGYDAVKNKKLNLRSITFVTGTSTLTERDKLYLDTIAVFLIKVPTVMMEVGGHTDNTGSVRINEQLSRDRANAVVRYVVAKGVIPRRMKAVGYGSGQPVADNATEVGRSLNRRVELKFLGLTNDIYTIVTKDGRKIPSTYMVISADGKSVSYRQNAGAPLNRLPASGIDYIEYPDGSRRRPDAIVLAGDNSGNAGGRAEKEPSPASQPTRSDVGKDQKVGQWLSGKFPKINRWSVMVNGGIAPLTVRQTAINFAYVDESPSRDNLQRRLQLSEAQRSAVGQVGFEWESDRQWLTRVQFQFGRSSQAGLSGVVFGLGKSFGRKSRLLASLDLSLGSAYVKLGDLVQNDVYIQVNNTQFYSDKVMIKFRNYYAALTPQLAYNFPLSPNMDLRLTGGYSYSFNTRSVLQFRGRDENEKRVKNKERLSAPNVNFLIGEDRVTDARLFNLRGVYGTVGLLYHLYYRSN